MAGLVGAGLAGCSSSDSRSSQRPAVGALSPSAATAGGPADLCDVLDIDAVNGFAGAALDQLGHGPEVCAWGGSDATGATLTVTLQRTRESTVADLPQSMPAIHGLGDAARGTESEVHVLIGTDLYTLVGLPTHAPGELARFAKEIVALIRAS